MLKNSKKPYKINKNISPEKDSSPPSNPPIKKREYPLLMLATFSVISILLYLLGFGIALSVENSFNIPYSTLFSSSFELIELSVWGISELAKGLTAILKFEEHYFNILMGSTPVFFFIVFITPFFVFFRIKRRMFSHIIQLSKNKVDEFISSKKDMNLTIKVWLATAWFWMVLPSIILFIPIILLIVIIFITVIPYSGLLTGDNYIRDYVIFPKSCAPITDRSTRIKEINQNDVDKHKDKDKDKDKIKKPSNEKYATCLLIKSINPDKKEIGKGRLVFSTSSATILFNPTTGNVYRIPTRNAIIEVVGNI